MLSQNNVILVSKFISQRRQTNITILKPAEWLPVSPWEDLELLRSELTGLARIELHLRLGSDLSQTDASRRKGLDLGRYWNVSLRKVVISRRRLQAIIFRAKGQSAPDWLTVASNKHAGNSQSYSERMNSYSASLQVFNLK